MPYFAFRSTVGVYVVGVDVDPYKVQFTQQLMPAEHSQHCRYGEWVLEQQAVDGNFSKKFSLVMKLALSYLGF